MADISKITLPDGSEYDLKDARAREIPLESKTYTNIIATANDNNGGGFFYLKVRGTTYDSKWKVKVHVHATVPGNVNYDTDSDFIIWGRQNTYSSYFSWNNIFNTSYRPIYYNSVFFVSSTGYTNNCANWIGFNLYNSTNPIDTSYKRTITVDLLSYENCAVELQDTPITPTNIPNRAAHTNWYSSTNTSYSNFDACSNGLKQTGDANTTNITNVYAGNGTYIADSALYRYQLLFQTNENTLTPLTNANNVTATTKTMLTNVEFDPFGRIFYYNTTTAVAAGASISAGALYYMLSGFDARYGFNITTSTFTAHKPLYLVVTPLPNGKCKIASTTPWAQELPTTNDGKWYIYIGRTYSGYQCALYPYHPVYYHDGTKVQQVLPADTIKNATTVNGHTVGVDVPSDAVFTDTTYQSKVAASGGTEVSLVTTGEKYTWNSKTNTRVKGNAESSYRTGDVNLTPAHIGAISKTDELQTTNSFAPASLRGPYISKIDNAFYCADKRWSVTATNSSGSISNLFDGSYESTLVVNGTSTSVITLDFSGVGNGYFPGYPYGYILVSFYYTGGPSSISGRVYCNYEAHGIGWHNLSFSPVSDNTSTNIVYRSEHQGLYNISKLEISVTGIADPSTKICQIEMHLDRPDSSRTPFLSKYAAETLYYPLTAPSFVGDLTGNASTATKATQDESGNNIKATYASSMSISDHTLTLKNKNGSTLSTVTVPDTTYTAATAAPGKVASSSSVGTSTNYARQDHTHGIDLAAGDSNGQIKIAGTNVSVKGLGSAAYTDSTAYLASSLKGANNGVAELDSSGKVPTSQLPSYVDDVLEYSAKSSFPATGETGKIYVDTGTNLTYRWSGSAYVEISPSLALGTTSSTAFRGDYGNSAYTHAVTNKGSAFSSGLYKITTNSEGHVTAATAVAKADITGLGIPGSDTNTHRPIKVNSTQILGDNTTALNLVPGTNMSITSDSNGTVTFNASGSAMPFMIVQQPVPVGISADNTIVTFSIVLAGGTGSYTYQWQLMSGGTDWIDLGGSQESSIDILGHLVTDTIHRCVVSDGVTTLYSNPVYYYGTNSGTTGVKQSINDGNYGVCSTAAGTAAKTVSIPGLIVQPGVTIHVKFTNTNSASNPTLAVNSTPAKSIVLYGTTAIGTTAETTGWNAGAVVALTYDGTYWIRDQGYNTNTTYSNATTSSAGLMSAADKTAVNALKNLSTLEYEIVS